ncbi:MAG: hypothetical protein RLN82_03575, partial [Pseudomonadales bacterium]
MNSYKASIFEFIGITAVVLSLLFVAYQIQQTNVIAQTTTEYEIRNNFASNNEFVMATPELRGVLLKSSSSDAEYSADEMLLMTLFSNRLSNIWQATLLAYQNGMVSEETYDMLLYDIQSHIRIRPGMHRHWRSTLTEDRGNIIAPLIEQFLH